MSRSSSRRGSARSSPSEHPQTAALVLSKLAPQAAANVLLTLDKAARGEIVKRMMSMADDSGGGDRRSSRTSCAARLLVESATQGHFRRPDTRRQRAQRDGQGPARRGDAGPRSVRHAATSRRCASRLFAFEDIPLLTQKARVALFDGISTELVTLALRNAQPALVEAVLSSIGARSRRMIESELGAGRGQRQRRRTSSRRASRSPRRRSAWRARAHSNCLRRSSTNAA